MIYLTKFFQYAKLVFILFIGSLLVFTFYILFKDNFSGFFREDVLPSSESELNAEYEAPSLKHKVYTDTDGLWSFEYPNDWVLKEYPATKRVSLFSSELTSFVEGSGRYSPVFSVTFSNQKKTDFVSVGTKVGNISFSSREGALVDSSDTNIRCLPTVPLLGKNKSISAFMYGGSLMSTPAYWNYAVLTDREYLVLLSVDSYGNLDNGLLQSKFEAEKKHVFDSFKLLGDIKAFVPACTPQ
jgi:hypothetical protein